MSKDNISDLKNKMTETANKISEYVDGMEKIVTYINTLDKITDEANKTLERSKKENKLTHTAKTLEKMMEELRKLKLTMALFSDRGSLIRQRMENALRMTAVIRDIDARIIKISQNFNRLNKECLDELLLAVSGFEKISREINMELKRYHSGRRKDDILRKDIIKKIKKLTKLREKNDMLDREIHHKMRALDAKKFSMVCNKIKELNEEKEIIYQANSMDKSTRNVNIQKEMERINEGDYIILGKIKGTDITWQVLEKTLDKILLLSRYGLTCKQFSNCSSSIWENSILRTYLNDKFLKKCFNSYETEMIVSDYIGVRSRNSQLPTDTYDRVFLLGVSDVERYFSNDSELVCCAADKGKTQTCEWWLRDSGHNTSRAATINKHGRVNSMGKPVGTSDVYIRPAMWIKPTGLYPICKVGEETVDNSMVFYKSEEEAVREESTVSADSCNVSTDIINDWTFVTQGDIVRLGKWNDKDLIWKVVDEDECKFMLMSIYGLPNMRFHDVRIDAVTWEMCSLRQYLNQEFFDQSFSKEEKCRIVEVENIDYMASETETVVKTYDKVYIPSLDEIEHFGIETKDLVCRSIENNAVTCEWWLRTMGKSGKSAKVVDKNGDSERHKRLVYGIPKVGVRPVIWVKKD